MPFACSCNSYMMIMYNVRFLLSFVSSFHLLYFSETLVLKSFGFIIFSQVIPLGVFMQ